MYESYVYKELLVQRQSFSHRLCWYDWCYVSTKFGGVGADCYATLTCCIAQLPEILSNGQGICLG